MRLGNVVNFFKKPWVNIVSVIAALITFIVFLFPFHSNTKLNVYKDRDFTVLNQSLGSVTSFGNEDLNLNVKGHILRISRFKVENYGHEDLRKEDFEGDLSLVVEIQNDEKLVGYSFFGESRESISKNISCVIHKDSTKLFFLPFNLRKNDWFQIDLWTISGTKEYPVISWSGNLLDTSISYYEDGEGELLSKGLSKLWKFVKSRDFLFYSLLPAIVFYGLLGLIIWGVQKNNNKKLRAFLSEFGYVNESHFKLKRIILKVFKNKRLKSLKESIAYLLDVESAQEGISDELNAYKHFLSLKEYQKGQGVKKSEVIKFKCSLPLKLFISLSNEGLVTLNEWDKSWVIEKITEEKLLEIYTALRK